MTARQKIEALTNSWYGYAVFGAVASLWYRSWGFFSLVGTAASFVFTIFVTWLIGRRLLAKSSLTRVCLVILTSLFSIFGTIGVAKAGWAFLRSGSFDMVLAAIMCAMSVYMNVKSFRVLTDASVKAYFD